MQFQWSGKFQRDDFRQHTCFSEALDRVNLGDIETCSFSPVELSKKRDLDTFEASKGRLKVEFLSGETIVKWKIICVSHIRSIKSTKSPEGASTPCFRRPSETGVAIVSCDTIDEFGVPVATLSSSLNASFLLSFWQLFCWKISRSTEKSTTHSSLGVLQRVILLIALVIGKVDI